MKAFPAVRSQALALHLYQNLLASLDSKELTLEWKTCQKPVITIYRNELFSMSLTRGFFILWPGNPNKVSLMYLEGYYMQES